MISSKDCFDIDVSSPFLNSEWSMFDTSNLATNSEFYNNFEVYSKDFLELNGANMTEFLSLRD